MTTHERMRLVEWLDPFAGAEGDDLAEGLREIGLEVVEVIDAFLSKVVVARKPEAMPDRDPSR